ncbi:MAG: hypothetical protein AAGA87_12135 [Pseudomonadota bacterium]
MIWRVTAVCAVLLGATGTNAKTYDFTSEVGEYHFSDSFFASGAGVTGQSKAELRASWDQRVQEHDAACQANPGFCVDGNGTFYDFQAYYGLQDFETEYEKALSDARDAGRITRWSTDHFNVTPTHQKFFTWYQTQAAFNTYAFSDARYAGEEGVVFDFNDGVALESFTFAVTDLNFAGPAPANFENGLFAALVLEFPGIAGAFTYADFAGTQTFTFAPGAGDVGILAFSVIEYLDVYFGAEITQITVADAVATVPLPASWLLLATGGLLLGLTRRGRT